MSVTETVWGVENLIPEGPSLREVGGIVVSPPIGGAHGGFHDLEVACGWLLDWGAGNSLLLGNKNGNYTV